MHERHKVIGARGFTYSGKKMEGKSTVKSRINYFLISIALYDFVHYA